MLAPVGLGLGLVGAYFVGRAMKSTFYGVGSLDFGAIAAVALVLLGRRFWQVGFPRAGRGS